MRKASGWSWAGRHQLRPEALLGTGVASGALSEAEQNLPTVGRLRRVEARGAAVFRKSWRASYGRGWPGPPRGWGGQACPRASQPHLLSHPSPSGFPCASRQPWALPPHLDLTQVDPGQAGAEGGQGVTPAESTEGAGPAAESPTCSAQTAFRPHPRAVLTFGPVAPTGPPPRGFQPSQPCVTWADLGAFWGHPQRCPEGSKGGVHGPAGAQ